MPKNDLQKHTLLLFAGDFERLGEMFPDLQTSVVIRKIVREFIHMHEAKPTTAMKEMKVGI